jgi:hypothetical protein
MAEPKNPQQIILKNQFYEHGLKEIDIWEHYQKNKRIILNETRLKEVIFFLATDVNKTVVLRNYMGKPIYLTPSNYDFMIGGRTLSVHTTMGLHSKYGLIDIDISDFNRAKDITEETYFFLNKAPFVDSCEIRFTGKDSFHVKANFKKEFAIDDIRYMLKDYFENETMEVGYRYTVKHKREAEIPNIDLATNKHRGSHIALGALSVMGLECVKVDIKRLKSFRKEMAVIKTKK